MSVNSIRELKKNSGQADKDRLRWIERIGCAARARRVDSSLRHFVRLWACLLVLGTNLRLGGKSGHPLIKRGDLVCVALGPKCDVRQLHYFSSKFRHFFLVVV